MTFPSTTGATARHLAHADHPVSDYHTRIWGLINVSSDRTMFPHYCADARQHLGIPDSPVIHLAIATVADQLMPLSSGTTLTPDLVRITALRCASGAALNQMPFECAVLEFRQSLGIDIEADRAAADQAFRTVRTDWLRAAKEQIVAEGHDPGPDAQRMATAYGWNPSPPAPPAPLPTPKLAETMVDETGRAWRMPTTNEELFDLLNQFGRLHGRPSRAVHEAFRRHHQLDAMRLLVVRGAEGQCLNLAARALALGAWPPIVRTSTTARPGWPGRAEQLRKLQEEDAKRDRQLHAELEAEADTFRAKGYAD